MKTMKLIGALAAGAAFANSAFAAEILVNADIVGSVTWTANNTYNLQQQIYVLPGATLTIEAGTVIASDTNIGGSLAVTKGAQIFIQGTHANPVIFTSKADVATWVGGDPKTGTWREAANEWGNLTIMGGAYISENATAGNTPTPNAANVATMEGLTAAFPGDTRVLYGGGNDDDDSGTISYVSMRYTGKVIALNNELNGMSLGGIGRATDIHHVDIMNNIDDGIEIWGGTVNLKYVNIWNIGDDTFDVDQGWRGKAQFILAVQGYAVDGAQGSGVGDNIFEIDGAEQSDYQPVTTASIYNVTMIGQPSSNAGDHATAWRDGARVQFRNCVVMDLGDNLINNDNVDGDGGQGYGFGGTLTFAQTWTTPYNAVPAHANDPFPPIANFYSAQSAGSAAIGQGFLSEITDSVFFRNLNTAYGTSDTVGVTVAGGSAPLKGNTVIAGALDADSPIQTLTRGGPVTRGGTTQLPVTFLDPRPKNAALTSLAAAPADGFFTPANYRGAFSTQENWLCKWTASFAFGFTPNCEVGTPFCAGDNLDPNVTTDCPCSNFGAAGRGCASSFNASGAKLSASGSITGDTVVLLAEGVNATGNVIYMRGNVNNVVGTVFGDGVRCVDGSLIRRTKPISTPNQATFPAPADTVTLSTGWGPANITAPGSGITAYYMAYYRNASAAFCPPETFNGTNAISITW